MDLQPPENDQGEQPQQAADRRQREDPLEYRDDAPPQRLAEAQRRAHHRLIEAVGEAGLIGYGGALDILRPPQRQALGCPIGEIPRRKFHRRAL